MNKLKKWFLRNFVCETIFSKGHIPVKEVRETESRITQYKCKRCDCTLGLGYWKHIPPPPESYGISIEKWKQFKDEHLNNLRKGITIYQ